MTTFCILNSTLRCSRMYHATTGSTHKTFAFVSLTITVGSVYILSLFLHISSNCHLHLVLCLQSGHSFTHSLNVLTSQYPLWLLIHKQFQVFGPCWWYHSFTNMNAPPQAVITIFSIEKCLLPSLLYSHQIQPVTNVLLASQQLYAFYPYHNCHLNFWWKAHLNLSTDF